ncbi:FtsX-like permease family protein, partial [Kitasatospora sp. MBT63]|uniref:FtsX-like permease family protein n=1 Tax=Kitasatospora sp. MBT63 TaxID=1444768 RepID=UPI00068A1CD2
PPAPTDRPAPTVRLRRLGQVGIGLRLAFTGGRGSLARTLLTAVGVGLGVATLLFASSFQTMKHHRDDRIHALVDTMHADDGLAAGPGTLLLVDASTTYHGAEVRGRIVQPEGPRAPLPPGLTAFPAPGTMAVSPALAELLGSPDGRLLEERIGHPVAGRIADRGLVGPGDLSFVLGADDLSPERGAVRIDSIGDSYPPRELEPELVLLSVTGIVVLLTPVVVFVAAATRFGGEARDRRLAALRLVGADRAMTARIAAGEALAGALTGLAVGWLLFLLAGHLAESVTIEGLSVFAADIDPDPWQAATVMAAVPLLAVAAALLAMRRITAEPLGVVRGSDRTRRRLWWRLALPVTGGLLLSQTSPGVDLGASPFDLAVVVAGLVLLLSGVAAVLPALLELTVRDLSFGPPSVQLALGRLRLGGGAAARATSGTLVAVAGAVVLQSLFGAIAAQHRARYADADGPRAGAVQARATFPGADGSAAELAARLRVGDGARSAVGYLPVYLRGATRDPNRTSLALVGSCADLKALAELPSCTDGDGFLLTGTGPAAAAGPGLRPGAEVTADRAAADGSALLWRLPAALLPAVERPLSPADGPAGDLLLTPAAVPAALTAGQDARVDLELDTAVPDAREVLRTAVQRIDPQARLLLSDERAFGQDRAFDGVRRSLTAAVVATLVLIALSMLVSLLEQLRERRRSLACLLAFGTPRRTLGLSLLWQSALPTGIGLLLAVGLGSAVGRMLLHLAGLPPRIAWDGVLAMAGAAAAGVLGVTALTLPVLRRTTATGALRHE